MSHLGNSCRFLRENISRALGCWPPGPRQNLFTIELDIISLLKRSSSFAIEGAVLQDAWGLSLSESLSWS